MHRFICFSVLLLPGLAQANEPPSVAASLGQMVMGLGVVIALLLGTLWLIKRLAQPRGPGNALKVIGGVALGSRERIMLVEVADKVLVVGVTTANIRTLHVLEASEIAQHLASAEAAGSSAAPRGDFQKWLQHSLTRRQDDSQA